MFKVLKFTVKTLPAPFNYFAKHNSSRIVIKTH